MSLTLWKLHSAVCKQTPALQNLPLAERRFFKKCRCACWVTGTHHKTGEFIKRSLGTTSWETGENLVRELENSTPLAIEARKITIKQAFEMWFTDMRSNLVSEGTIESSYANLEIKVLKYAAERGLTLVRQLDKQETYKLIMSPLWQAWKPSTRKRHMGSLRAFFKFAVEREWMEKNPLTGVKTPKTDFIQVDPYTPEEEDLLEAAFRNWAPNANGGQWAERPATLLCLKHVLEDTALRISDAQQIRPAIITELANGHGECTLLQTKMDGDLATGSGEVTVYLRPETIAEMKRIPWISIKYPFMQACAHENDRVRWKRHLNTEYKKIYNAMQDVGETVGVANCRPHRFRHTFATKHLTNGMELGKVSRLLGHKDIKTTFRYYASWTDKRQDQLRDEVMSSREAKPGVLQMEDARKAG